MKRVFNLRALSGVALALVLGAQGASSLEAAESAVRVVAGAEAARSAVLFGGVVADSSRLTLTVVSGNDAEVVFGESIAPLVRVEDGGRAAEGAKVRFRVVSGGGVLADSVVVTGPDGTAQALWLPGASAGVQKLEASVAGATVELSAKVAAPEAGKSYFGRNEYVEYIPGELPIILSSPHAGLLRPEEIPDRQRGVKVRDGAIHDIALRTADILEQLTGKRPHVVLMHLRRVKLDPNREIVEAAQGDPYAERAWHEYHGWIDIAKELVGDEYGRGFYIDLHGHGHKEQRLELGYLLRGRELALSDEEINKPRLVKKSSVRNLASKTPGGLAELLRGETSFGQILVKHGYRAVPSKSEPHPDGQPYFNGGYSTRRHGSRDGGTIDGVQIEHNSRGVRNSADARAAYSRALAESILEFLEIHMDLQLRKRAQ